MIWVKNKWFPFGRYRAITIWPFCFYKGAIDLVTQNHERIHARQQLELLIIPFYIIYFFEWIFKGYRNVSFEKEAYDNEYNLLYLERFRKFWGMWR